MCRTVRYNPCNTSRERSFAESNSASSLINLPQSEVALDPIFSAEQQHCLVPFAAQADRNWPDSCRLPTGFSELDCAVLRGFQRDKIGVRRYLARASLEKQM